MDLGLWEIDNAEGESGINEIFGLNLDVVPDHAIDCEVKPQRIVHPFGLRSYLVVKQFVGLKAI